MKTKATVLCPATIANIVCGFDVLGLALESPCDEITLTMHKGLSNITIENFDSFQLKPYQVACPPWWVIFCVASRVEKNLVGHRKCGPTKGPHCEVV